MREAERENKDTEKHLDWNRMKGKRRVVARSRWMKTQIKQRKKRKRELDVEMQEWKGAKVLQGATLGAQWGGSDSIQMNRNAQREVAVSGFQGNISESRAKSMGANGDEYTSCWEMTPKEGLDSVGVCVCICVCLMIFYLFHTPAFVFRSTVIFRKRISHLTWFIKAITNYQPRVNVETK